MPKHPTAGTRFCELAEAVEDHYHIIAADGVITPQEHLAHAALTVRLVQLADELRAELTRIVHRLQYLKDPRDYAPTAS